MLTTSCTTSRATRCTVREGLSSTRRGLGDAVTPRKGGGREKKKKTKTKGIKGLSSDYPLETVKTRSDPEKVHSQVEPDP